MLSFILSVFFNCLFFQNASLSRAFKLFRALGLRHIVVIDENNKVGGVPVVPFSLFSGGKKVSILWCFKLVQ